MPVRLKNVSWVTEPDPQMQRSEEILVDSLKDLT